MKKNLIIVWIISIFVILSFSGCVPSKPVYVKQILPADRLIKRLEANRRRVKTFEGSGVLSVNSPSFTGKVNFDVVLKEPDSVKISIFGPLGLDLAQALITNSKFTFYDAVRNNVFTGRNKEKVLKRIFKVDISFSDLMEAFAGAVNLTSKLTAKPDVYKIINGSYFLTYLNKKENLISLYKINVSNFAVTTYQLLSHSKKVIFESQFLDFQNFDHIPIPYKTIVENNLKNQSINIDYRNIKINIPINKMKLAIPSDAKIYEW